MSKTVTIEQLEARLEAVERRVRVQWALMLLVFIAGCCVGYSAHGSEQAKAALLDRQRFPEHEWHDIYYLSTAESFVPDRTARVGAFVFASTSRQQIIERCVPQKVTPTLYRFRLSDLKWDLDQWASVVRDYPYAVPRTVAGRKVVLAGNLKKRVASKVVEEGRYTVIAEDGTRIVTTKAYFDKYVKVGGYVTANHWHTIVAESLPLVVRLDWLIVRLTDANESDAYYRLLYGKSIPKTRDEFLKFWEATKDVKHTFGLIEGESQVSSQKIRQVKVYRGFSHDVALTEDSFRITSSTDPLNNPGGNFKHDGEEGIVMMSKASIARGASVKLQAYFLADGDGKRIEKADGDLVVDHTKFRGRPQIRTSGSCIQCHAAGLNPPTLNEFRYLLQIGVDVYAKRPEVQNTIEWFMSSDFGKYITRNNEDFAEAIDIVNGLSPERNALEFKSTVNAYDRQLGLEDAARELGVDEITLKIALIRYTEQINLPRMLALALGHPVPRSVWEEQYPAAVAAMAAFNASKPKD